MTPYVLQGFEKDDSDSQRPKRCELTTFVRRVASMHPAKPHTIYGVHERWSWSILLSLALLFDVPCVRAQSTTSESLAEINGETITTEELNRALGARLSQLEEQIYNLKSRELDALIAQCLLAQETARLRDALGELTVTPASSL
jgi:hypothetical protein